MNGKLFIFSAPSGSGKTTIVKSLLSKGLGLEFSISATSRPKRGNEADGADYYFLTANEFKKKIAEGDFIEWEEVYKDRFYGTLKTELDRIWGQGKHVIFDVDVIGGINIKKQFPERAVSVFIMPPSLEELERRLLSRSTDSNEDIKIRLNKAKAEIEYSGRFDHIIVNDVLDRAIEEAEGLVRKFIGK